MAITTGPVALPGSAGDGTPARVPVQPYRRLQIATTSAVPGVRRLEIEHFANDQSIATDTLRLAPGTTPPTLLTAHRADSISITNRGSPVEVAITDLGQRPPIGRHLMLLGAMKSGTTSLYDHLVQHPAIAENHTAKEPDFFAEPLSQRGHFDYYSQYRYDPRRHRWALDGSTNYTKQRDFPGVPQRLAELPGEMKFIYLMRDPVSRIESHIAHNVAHRRWNPQDLDTDDLLRCIDVSSYSRQLDVFAEVFDDFRERLLLIDFRDVITAMPRVLRKIEQFAGLTPHDYRFLPASNVRRSNHGANQFRVSHQQREWFWEQLANEPARLRKKYGFAPREPWSQPTQST